MNFLCSFCRRRVGLPCGGCQRRSCSYCHLDTKHLKICARARREAGVR